MLINTRGFKIWFQLDYHLLVFEEVKLFAHCSLLVTFCWLFVTFCSLLVTLCLLLVTFCSLLVTFYSLVDKKF